MTLQDCFEEFRKPEMLDEDNKWYCNKCKDHVRAKKQMDIFRAPPILIINLKRFKQSGQSSRYWNSYSGGGYGSKIDSVVSFPLDGFDLNNLILSKIKDSKETIYDLYAVSNHYGNMGFGHYTAFARNPINGKWYEFDDSRVQELKYDS